MGPALSRLQHNTIPPLRLMVPKVGLKPVAPVRVEGDTIEPKVSVPIVNANKPATTEAAEPADQPLEPCARFHGLRVKPPNQRLSYANAPSESLAQRTAPAFFNWLYTKEFSSMV